jgi:hypothetical protein
MLNVPLPVPVAVAPLLRVAVHAPMAVTVPVMFADAPAHTAALLLLMAAVGRAFIVTIVLPVKPAETAEHLLSEREASV